MKFEEVYKKHKWLIRKKAESYYRSTGEDFDELESFLTLVFWKEFKKYDEQKSSFTEYIGVRLDHRLIDYVNKRQREFERSSEHLSALVKEDEEGELREYEIEDTAATEEISCYGENKTDEDKRQLINVLVKNTDSLTTAIVNEFLNDDGATPTAIGRKLGTHHQTVRRKLDALARKYYANHDEDIIEYLAV